MKTDQLAGASLVQVAREMLSGELSFFDGALKVVALQADIEGLQERDKDFDVFALICSETDHLPHADQRDNWSPEALARLEREFTATEDWARPFAASACSSLISRFGTQ